MTIIDKTTEPIHLAPKLHPIEAVLLDRVTFGWEDAFYRDVIDPMTPWYPADDEMGETPEAEFTEAARKRAARAALEAVVSSLVDSLQGASDGLGAGPGRAAQQLRSDLSLTRQAE